ncbi:MAG: BatA domain-containing protein [Kiritimatiellae bacterium]|nr:BatA domain-containing protein [Kiritimatiellia bacterium]
MSALSGVFLWLLPLAFLPVIIHMLNRLRYRTVKWAAMMFLRTADRDASRRAKIRQWIILAARCLMLAAFLLALSRLQTRGRLARFFDQGSSMVVVIFDRSPGMELQRGGSSGRERALGVLRQGIDELGPTTRVVWLDSATGNLSPLPRGVDLNRLPQTEASSVPTDMQSLLNTALAEIARAGVSDAEVWIPGDRRAATWLPPGASSPDWSDWTEMNTEVTLRFFDVASVGPDSGNRTLQMLGEPVREGNRLLLNLRLLRDRADQETVTMTVDTGGLTFQEELMVEGVAFRWVQSLEVSDETEDVHAFFSLPADANPQDNEVAVSWRPRGPLRAKVDVRDSAVNRAVRAGILPRANQREIAPAMAPLDGEIALWVRDGTRAIRDVERTWLEAGGVLLELPGEQVSRLDNAGEDGMGVGDWLEDTGILGPDLERDPLRMDLLRVYRSARLEEVENRVVVARLEDGTPLLTREDVGDGAIYRLSTLPLPDWSNLDAGYIWVPVLQRMLREGRRVETRRGTHRLGDWRPHPDDEWSALDGEDRNVRLHVGRYAWQGNVLAMNRSNLHDATDTLSMEELREWASPLDFRVFEDQSARGQADARRVEFTVFLALLGLLLLVIESFLLTLNIRRPVKHRSAWSASA